MAGAVVGVFATVAGATAAGAGDAGLLTGAFAAGAVLAGGEAGTDDGGARTVGVGTVCAESVAAGAGATDTAGVTGALGAVSAAESPRPKSKMRTYSKRSLDMCGSTSMTPSSVRATVPMGRPTGNASASPEVTTLSPGATADLALR